MEHEMMTNKDLLVYNGYEDVVVFENPSFEGALIGISPDNRAIYSYDKMIESAVQQEGWTEEEAADWIDYNTIKSATYVENSPIIMYSLMEV